MSVAETLNNYIEEKSINDNILSLFFKDFMRHSFTDNVNMGVIRKNCTAALINEPNIELLKKSYELINCDTLQLYKDEIGLFYTLSTMQLIDANNNRLNDLEYEIKNITNHITKLMMDNIF